MRIERAKAGMAVLACLRAKVMPLWRPAWLVLVCLCIAVGAYNALSASLWAAEAQDSAKSDQGIPDDQKEAVRLVRGFRSDVKACDECGRLYDVDLVRAILDVYKWGVGTAQAPGREALTRDFCREALISLLHNMVVAKGAANSGSSDEEADRRLPRFTRDAGDLLRMELAGFVMRAPKELRSEQIPRLYYLIGEVLDAGDTEAPVVVKTLKARAEEAGTPVPQQLAAKTATEDIEGRR